MPVVVMSSFVSSPEVTLREGHACCCYVKLCVLARSDVKRGACLLLLCQALCPRQK